MGDTVVKMGEIAKAGVTETYRGTDLVRIAGTDRAGETVKAAGLCGDIGRKRSAKPDHVSRRGTNRRQRIIAVCGVKNSGKTTLLARLVEELAKRGMKVAVMKHDGHDFTCDIEGTDSHRLKEAGAYGTAVFSDSRIFVHKTGTGERAEDLLAMFPEADLIFLEGMKDSTYPKIEIIRKGISGIPVSNPRGRFLIVTDTDRAEYEEEAVGFEDIERIIHKILMLPENGGTTGYERDENR